MLQELTTVYAVCLAPSPHTPHTQKVTPTRELRTVINIHKGTYVTRLSNKRSFDLRTTGIKANTKSGSRSTHL